MGYEQAPSRSHALSLASGCVGVIALFVGSAALFLPHQSIWIDESTQLSGLTLGPVEVARWLVDARRQDFGVPGDRMPPLSYWLGGAWAQLFGLTETSLRWFGIVCAAPAAGLVFLTAYRTFGPLPAWAAGLFFALSPNVCCTAVDIRAYPLFLLTSAAALYCFMRLVTDVEGGRQGTWAALAIWIVLGIYVHFFGVVLAGALLLALLVERLYRKQSVAPVLVIGVAVAFCAAGIIPFILGSVTLSGGGGERRDRVYEVVQLLYRLVAHGTMRVYGAAESSALLGAAALGIIGFLLPATKRGAYLALVGSLAAGLGVSIAANFVLSAFTAAKVSYATWAVPGVCVALAAGLSVERRWLRSLAGAAAVLLLAGESAGVAQLWTHGEYFAHGPHKPLQALLGELDISRTAVMHDGQSDTYFSVQSPLRYANGAGLTQLLVAPDGKAVVRLPLPPITHEHPWPRAEPVSLEELLAFSHLVLVRAREQRSADLAEQLRHGDRPLGTSTIKDALEASGQWRQRDHRLFVALVAADVLVLERVK
jgi:hypothetical protein